MAVAQTGAISGQQLEALLNESGKALVDLRAARDRSWPSALAKREDRRGRTIKDDLRDNVLAPEVENRLKSFESAATSDLRAGDLPGAQLNLAYMRRDLTVEIERFEAITKYWTETSSLKEEPRRRSWSVRNEQLQTNGVSLAPHAVEAAALETQLHQQIAAREFTAAMKATWPKFQEVARLADTEQSDLILGQLDKGELQNVLSPLPTRKCVPAKESSHTSKPAPRVKEFETSDRYVKKAARSGAVGSVAETIVVVDSRGCPERAILVGPSGNAAVDSGALNFMVDGYYFPAEKDGAPTRSAVSLNFAIAGPL